MKTECVMYSFANANAAWRDIVINTQLPAADDSAIEREAM